MQTQFRLGSVVPHGVGGPEAIFIDAIFSYLLTEFGQNVYKYIGINQIGDDLNELIIKEPGSKIYINIRYPVLNDFETKSEQEKKRARLDVVHASLLRIAEHDKKLDIPKLEAMRDKILEQDFSFEFVHKIYPNKKNKDLAAKVVVRPAMNEFNYSVLVEENGKEKCRVHIYRGLPGMAYFYECFFATGKWKNSNEFILSGKRNEVETIILIDKCSVDIINLTPYGKPPYYTLMQAGITEEQRKISESDYEHSLSPETRELLKKAALSWSDYKK